MGSSLGVCRPQYMLPHTCEIQTKWKGQANSWCHMHTKVSFRGNVRFQIKPESCRQHMQRSRLG
eukprot:2531468-Pleurochrysis_carterae.AAC.3